MNDILFNIGYGHFLVLAAVLFVIGIARRAPAPQRADHPDERRADAQRREHDADRVLAHVRGTTRSAHTFALIVIAVAAAEAAVGLAIVVAVFRGRRNVDVDRLTTLRH